MNPNPFQFFVALFFFIVSVGIILVIIVIKNKKNRLQRVDTRLEIDDNLYREVPANTDDYFIPIIPSAPVLVSSNTDISQEGETQEYYLV